MRWLPRSLFSRMVLILLGGLVVAQLASFAIHWRERGQLMLQTSGMRQAQRIADIVRLLDSLAPRERARIVGVIDAPQMRVSLTQPPLAPAAEDLDTAERATHFASLLQRFLGAERSLVVRVTSAPRHWPPPAPFAGPGRDGPPGPGMMAGPGMMHGPGGPGLGQPGMGPGPRLAGISFIVQAPLKDGTLVTFDSRQPLEAVNWPYRLLLSLGVLLVGVIVLTLFAVRWVTRPLKTLAEAAERLGTDIERPPLTERGPLEVSSAARAFNNMQRRLVAFIRDRTRILAAMSHDLKTPITRLRLRAELLDDAVLRAKFEKDLAEMESMVSATLDFMRGAENREPRQLLDVMALLESLQEDTAELNGRVVIEGAALKPYHGLAQALKRCLRNLIDNAVNYGRSATIRVEDSVAILRIRVCDEGPGIPEGELERVFEPFHRLEASRSRDTGGTGLGLSIARNIARAHGGDIVLRNLSAGGLEAVLTLPRTA
ncbi:MAG: ATP-binding protein [Betaproteobacteria bacterium]|nr:ATP-binding protein [Betaproteobacteria bacterium]MDH3437951.1 ATP-binding protein [Betaproteobacteria bacterium]